MKTKLFTLALLLISAGSFAQNTAKDEATIKSVCADFSEQWDKRNQSGVLAHLADVPYASRYWTNNAYNGNTAIRELVTKAVEASPKPTGVKRETSNWQLKALGSNQYWATYSQAITNQPRRSGEV